ncbi:hypothetical protein KSP40_PGU005351 [Platanthera guangdongensis]|uniref:Uncharacterized protein n=1 Tax=Platanthera guangdongensis TaxID=2320717 RepID=A0ABR2MJ40_9ASPA
MLYYIKLIHNANLNTSADSDHRSGHGIYGKSPISLKRALNSSSTAGIGGNERRGMQPSGRLALPSIPHAQAHPHALRQGTQTINANGGHDGQPSRRVTAASPGQPHMQASGGGKSQAGLNSYDGRFR